MSENTTIRHGHNQIVVKAGDRYNLSFDADFKKSLAKLRDERDRTLAVLLRCTDEITGLKSIIRHLTGDWVDDPLDYWNNHLPPGIESIPPADDDRAGDSIVAGRNSSEDE